MTVAVLFVRADSHYKTMPGVDAWDAERDAREYNGLLPVVAHPPCRAWGRYAHWAKPREGEKELALFAVEKVRQLGGVLEHPAASRLWGAAGLPEPGKRDEFGGQALVVNQSWWGHRAPKATRLYVVGASSIPEIPMKLGVAAGRIENMNVREREMTPPAFAEWLVELARRCRK